MIDIPTLKVNVFDSFIEVEKISGITKATIIANISKPELYWASRKLKFCRLYLSPPVKKDKPRTSNRFPITEPVKEASTIPIKPAFSVKIEIMSSTALQT